MLWDCGNCGTQQIAASIEECPVCHTPRPAEETTPTDVTTGSGADPKAGTDDPAAAESSDTFPADGAPAPSSPSRKRTRQDG